MGAVCMEVSKSNFSSSPIDLSNFLFSLSFLFFPQVRPRKTCLKAQNWRFFFFPSQFAYSYWRFFSPLLLKMRVMHKQFSWGLKFSFSHLPHWRRTWEWKLKWKEEEIFKKLSIVHHLGYFLFHSRLQFSPRSPSIV